MNYSHLRYPGGKSKIVPLIRLIIENDKKQNMTYIEPLAGGAGVVLVLRTENPCANISVYFPDCTSPEYST